MVEWGADNGHWFNQNNGRILRIDYTGSCSASGIVRGIPAQHAKWPIAAIYPGQNIQFPAFANSVNLYEPSGRLAKNIKKSEAGGSGKINTQYFGILFAEFKSE
jgi:hypothetical protein